ncbi:MAG: hypothetical protein IAE79_09790 [Anaerolinea sp.]|nr:hypothetical protein [Anaerolinea sp.]
MVQKAEVVLYKLVRKLSFADGREALAILEQPLENLSSGSEPGEDAAQGPGIAL